MIEWYWGGYKKNSSLDKIICPKIPLYSSSSTCCKYYLFLKSTQCHQYILSLDDMQGHVQGTGSQTRGSYWAMNLGAQTVSGTG